MPFDQSDAKWVVMNALKDVADFRSDNIEHFTFRRFRTYHKSVFLASLKLSIQQVVEGDRKYYDITKKDLLETNPGIGLGKLIAKLEEEK